MAAKTPIIDNAGLKKYVTVYVPMAPAGEEQQVLLAINGENRYVPRGKNVTLPRYAAEALFQVLKLEQAYEMGVAQTHKQERPNEQYVL